MAKVQKRIVIIILGLVFVVFSLLWMRNDSSTTNLFPALPFSVGLVLILNTIKNSLLGFLQGERLK